MSNFYTPQQAMFRLSDKNSAFITQTNASGKGKSLTMTIALAMTACAMVSLPGGNVDSPEEYFLSNAGVIAAEAIETVNQILPVDYKTAMTLAKDLYLIRYEQAMRPFSALGYDYDDGLSTLFGLNAHLPTNVIECIRKDARVIIKNIDRLKSIIDSIRKE